MALKFKKVGWFCEELSARYETRLTANLKVRIFKCPYLKGFRLDLITNSDYGLDEETGDLMSTLWDGMSKKEIIYHIEELVKDTKFISELDDTAKYWETRITNHVYNLKK